MSYSKVAAFRVFSLLLLAISLFCCVDFLQNYQSATLIEDGSIICTSLLHKLFGVFGDRDWTLRNFNKAFCGSLWVSLFVGVENILLACYCIIKRQQN